MKKKVVLISLIVILFIGLIAAIVVQNNRVEKKEAEIQKLLHRFSSENNMYKKMAKTKDSLIIINKLLAKYRVLTEAMTYRDSIRLGMPYKIGDVVHMKRDSSRAIISDIVVGGSRHDYYIRYKVTFKNNTTEEVIPELLY